MAPSRTSFGLVDVQCLPGKPLRLRPFGSRASDIEFDFDQANRVQLELELLGSCCDTVDGRPVDEDLLLDLSIGERTEALLKLAHLGNPRPLAWTFRCEQPECRSENEIEMTLDELVAFADRVRDKQHTDVEWEGKTLVVRRPTGRDQLAWMEAAGAVSAEAVLAAVVVSPEMGEICRTDAEMLRVQAPVDAAMQDFDPLAAFEMEAVCPGCGAMMAVTLELAQAALERLAAQQKTLLTEVHLLASRYHWEEAAILKLPAWRREFYLARIDAGGWTA